MTVLVILSGSVLYLLLGEMAARPVVADQAGDKAGWLPVALVALFWAPLLALYLLWWAVVGPLKLLAWAAGWRGPR